jgi:hypothetical protein
MYGKNSRLPTKPGQLPTTTPILPRRFAAASAVANAAGTGRAPTHDLEQPHHVGRRKECRPTTDAGRDVALAMTSMSSVDVFVASTQSGRVTRSSSAKI